MTQEVKSKMKAMGFYELRDSTCEKCGVKFEHVEKEGEKVVLRCPQCGGNVGRLRQRGVLGPDEGTIEVTDVKSK